MRLIDADYLKNLPFERVIHTDFGDTAIPIEEIDNAPTVELDESVIQEVLNKRCMTAVANEYLIALHGKRPQGEWIWSDNRWNLGDWLCNKCEHYAHDKSNFCPNCGAEMEMPS